jgi:ELWxxDGT repeat protein/cysteine-rich repeat protein
MVKDIYPGSEGSNLKFFTNVNGTLFFTANDGVHGQELWKSDGTEEGTIMVKDINPGVNDATLYISSKYFTSLGSTLFFSAIDGKHGEELWKSDGTEAGTVVVKDIFPGKEDSYPQYFTNVNGTLFLTAYDNVHGFSLWKSDGTEEGTVIVKRFRPSQLTNANGTLFFTANDGIHGWELWKSNGTEEGTIMVGDINPGIYNASISNILNVNNQLFFTASDGIHGDELWSLAPEVCGDGINVITEECDDGNDIEDDGCTSMCQAGMAVPTNKQHFSYAPIWTPALSFISSEAKPIDFFVSYYRGGEYEYTVEVGLDQFLEPVDIYGAYTISTDPLHIYVLNPDGDTFNVFTINEIHDALTTGMLPEGLVPWKSNVTGPINEKLFIFLDSEIHQDIYNAYLLVTPVNNIDSYYLWETYYSIIATTIWEYILDDGQGSATVTFLTGPDGTIINKGSFHYSLSNNEFSGYFDGTVSLDEEPFFTFFSFDSTGTAFNPSTSLGINQSPYSLSVEGEFYFPSHCRGHGTYTIKFLNEGWVSGMSGNIRGEAHPKGGCVEFF